MNLKSISFYLGLFCIPLSLLAFINILYASYFDYFLSINSYFLTLLLSIIFSSGFYFIGRKSNKKINFIDQLVFQLLFWLSVLFIFNVDIFCAISFVAIKFIFSYIINYNSMRRLNVFDLYWIHPFYELIHILIQGNFVLLNLFRKPKKWSR